MKIGKLSRLFSAFEVTPEIQAKQAEQTQNTQPQAPVQATEAVRVSSSFGYSGEDSGESRSEKVARIKQAVQDGYYKPDSKEVAKAVINDLFA